VNTDLVAALQGQGVDAVGLSGVDGGLLSGPRTSAIRVVEDGKRKIRRGDHSGRIESVNEALLSTLLSGGFTPVVTVPMLADGDTPVNVDTDAAAGAIAAALDATLVVLTDVPGILEEPDDEESLFGDVNHPDTYEAVKGAAEGFMTRKVMALETAITGGAPEAIVASANEGQPVTTALSGGGTHVHPEAIQ
jgi:acetylglutamate/LysW-gamma-L-alpha-aminoadipate kinase